MYASFLSTLTSPYKHNSLPQVSVFFISIGFAQSCSWQQIRYTMPSSYICIDQNRLTVVRQFIMHKYLTSSSYISQYGEYIDRNKKTPHICLRCDHCYYHLKISSHIRAPTIKAATNPTIPIIMSQLEPRVFLRIFFSIIRFYLKVISR